MVTAGEEGFLSVLPAYLDHLFQPLLAPSTFVTEVYNINGKGEEGGVVYSEQLMKDNSTEKLMEKALYGEIYPAKNAYQRVTGGCIADIRKLKVLNLERSEKRDPLQKN